MWSRFVTSRESKDGKTFTTTFASAYQVVHSKDATVDDIYNDVRIPKLRDKLSTTLAGSYDWVFCTKVGDIQRISPIYSIVPCQWSGELGSKDDKNAINMKPKIKWKNSKASEPSDTDGFGQPITNSIGEPVDGITREISDWVLTVERNFLTLNLYAINTYLDSTNSDTFMGWPPGTCILDEYEAENINQDDVDYWKVNARLLFRVPYNTTTDRAWWARYRNEGLYERVGSSVTFSGGGGSGAIAYPVVSSSGVVTKIVVTSRGSGYTSVPTVSVSGGSGGSFTAVLTDKRVSSVTVGAGGTGYSSKIVRAVDDHKEPVTKPVLLKVTGEREVDASAAAWIERPKKAYSLPYANLGLVNV